MARALWNEKIIADSDETVVVEGNHYFPRESLRAEHFTESDTTSVCPWKGTARYYIITVDGQSNPDAAWYYPDPKEAAAQITDRIAFWKGVVIEA